MALLFALYFESGRAAIADIAFSPFIYFWRGPKSEYFLFDPLAVSTGYLQEFILIFRSITSSMLISNLSAKMIA
jgi:hypothetical protein